MKNKNGSASILVIFIFAIFAILGASLTKMVYNSYVTVNNPLQHTQAFYLAEAGIEKGKVELVHNPNWYTDLPFSLIDSAEWLINQAVGQRINFGEGELKIVREKDKDRLYSVGYQGRGVVVLKLEFSHPPFKSLEWEEL